MHEELCFAIKNKISATEVTLGETIQSLWSGYGEIVRVSIQGHSHKQAILKYVKPPASPSHPRGWNTAASHARKIESYKVESSWYEHYSSLCNHQCKVPDVLAVGQLDDAQWLLLEDLDRFYPVRRAELSLSEAEVCLQWLANFHATFLSVPTKGLWPVGCYWHLNTRQAEYEVMEEGELKAKAGELDRLLNEAEHQTLVHGDAKVANFCFNLSSDQVAAVDFQYIGRGVGIRDVVYFLGSCISEDNLKQADQKLLNLYFKHLKLAVVSGQHQKFIQAIEEEWRFLYAIAWTDFYRFLQGWMPNHTKVNSYTKSLAKQALLHLR